MGDLTIVQQREKAYALRREVGVTARQDIGPALRRCVAALADVDDALQEAKGSPYPDPLVDELTFNLIAARSALTTAERSLTAARTVANRIVHFPVP